MRPQLDNTEEVVVQKVSTKVSELLYNPWDEPIKEYGAIVNMVRTIHSTMVRTMAMTLGFP